MQQEKDRVHLTARMKKKMQSKQQHLLDSVHRECTTEIVIISTEWKKNQQNNHKNSNQNKIKSFHLNGMTINTVDFMHNHSKWQQFFFLVCLSAEKKTLKLNAVNAVDDDDDNQLEQHLHKHFMCVHRFQPWNKMLTKKNNNELFRPENSDFLSHFTRFY